MNHAFYYMLIPAVAGIFGGLLTLFWNPDTKTRSLIQHFTAGIILAALAVEVLPDIEHQHVSPLYIIPPFLIGVMFMYGMKLYSAYVEQGDKENNFGLMLASFIDIAVDGSLIGAGFAAGGSAGIILSLGIAVEILFLGLSMMSDTIKGTKLIITTSFLSLNLLAFAIIGYNLLSGVSGDIIIAVLSFGVAALLYLVTDELLVEAHEVEEHPSSTLWLFAGFLIFWSLQLFS